MGFLKSFFSGKPDNPMAEQEKAKQKNFDIFKYDGMRAQRMGRLDYAIRCFTEALAIHDDFETRNYLAQAYTHYNQPEEARKQLEQMAQMEPTHTSTFLALANICYMLEDYPAMAQAAQKAISLEEYRQSMQGIYSECLNNDTKDESPMVYKPKDEIITNIQDTVTIVNIIKPIFNFKASE